MKKYRVFDTHVHVFPEKIAHKAVKNLGEYYNVNMAEDGTWDTLLRCLADEPQIEKCLIHSTATKAAQVQNVNDFVASKINDRFLGFGSIHPDYKNIPEEVDRIIKLGLRGIKLHPDFQEFNADSKEAFKIYEAAEGRIPVLFHVGDLNRDFSAPRRIRRIHDNFPHLTIIAAHMGGYSAWDEASEYLVGQDVYFDTSSSVQLMSREKAVRLIKEHGAERCLFGTDFPMHNPKNTLEYFLSLGLSDSENQKILWDNAAALLK